MEVNATGGDLGEADVSKSRVKQVQHDQAGQVESVVIQKGILFRKEVEVPAERIAQVTSASEDEAAATVVVQMSQFGLGKHCGSTSGGQLHADPCSSTNHVLDRRRASRWSWLSCFRTR